MEQSSYPQYPQQSQQYPQRLGNGQFRMNMNTTPMPASTTGQYPQQPSQYPHPSQQPQVPQKPEPAKLTRGGKIVLLIFAGLIIAVVAWSAGAHSAASRATPAAMAVPTAASTQPPTTTAAAYQLASIDHPGIAQDDPRVGQYQADLDTLHSNTGNDETAIANGTIRGQQLLQQKGHAMTILAIMDAMKKVTAGKTGVGYADALATWVTLVENS